MGLGIFHDPLFPALADFSSYFIFMSFSSSSSSLLLFRNFGLQWWHILFHHIAVSCSCCTFPDIAAATAFVARVAIVLAVATAVIAAVVDVAVPAASCSVSAVVVVLLLFPPQWTFCWGGGVVAFCPFLVTCCHLLRPLGTYLAPLLFSISLVSVML